MGQQQFLSSILTEFGSPSLEASSIQRRLSQCKNKSAAYEWPHALPYLWGASKKTTSLSVSSIQKFTTLCVHSLHVSGSVLDALHV